MAYKLIVDLTKVNRNVGGNKKKYIVMHYTGNNTDTASANANYFRSTWRGASAHYFVDDHYVVQVVKDDDCAWHVGKNYGKNNLFGTVNNANSIGIEMCSTNGKITDATFANAVTLAKSLMSKYGIPTKNVVRHWDVCSKVCPGWWGWGANGQNASIWNNFKAQIGGAVTPVPTPAPAPSAKSGDMVYQTYTQGKGWLPDVVNYNTSNEDGYAGWMGIPILALRANVKGDEKMVGYLEYRAHVLGGNWLNWQRDREKDKAGENFAGTLKNKLDGLQMRVVGVPGKHVKYRVHCIGKGWLDWVTDYGDGDNGYAGWWGYAIDAVQIQRI